MKSYLIIGVNNNASFIDLFRAISNNFNIDLSTLKEKDFIKSNNSYICKNSRIINKIINYNKDFNNDVIDQILYFKTEPEYINFINIIKLDKDTLIKNSSKNLILPNYFNNPNYDDYYVIDFNIINYIKFIQEDDTFDENINKLNNINNIFKDFDIKKYNPNFIEVNVFCDHFKEDLFDIITNYINKHLNICNNDYYKTVGYNDNVYIITDENVNKFINENIDEIAREVNDLADSYIEHTQINIDKKYIDKIDIDYMSIGTMYDNYKDNPNRDKIILDDCNFKDAENASYRINPINNYWDFIVYYHDFNSESLDTYFLIYSDYLDKANFI